MMVPLLWAIVFCMVLYYLLWLLNFTSFKYWKSRGVVAPMPTFLVGNVGEILFAKRNLGDIFADIYRAYPNLPFVGLYRGLSPSLLIRDPELIKKILVKDFQYFVDNEVFVSKRADPIYGRNMFCLKGEEWKRAKSQISPCFTSGKMKGLFGSIVEISLKLLNYIEKTQKHEGVSSLEAKELGSKYAINVVASVAYGLEGGCFEDDDSKFRSLGRDLITPRNAGLLKYLLMLTFPGIAKYIPLRVINAKTEKNLSEIIRGTLKHRQENGIVRNDFLDQVGMPKGSDQKLILNEQDIFAHCASFFIDGFETTAITISFILFELAYNPHVQNNLRQEIKDCLEKYDVKFTYECVQDMTYLDAILHETLRKYPVLPFLFKTCTKTYTCSSKNNKSVVLKPGDSVIISLFGFSNDEQYFKEPEKFDPTRYLGDNKMNETKYVHLPFGEGPRHCVGQNLAKLDIKIAVSQIVKNFEVRLDLEKTRLPLKMDPTYIFLSPVGGIWLNFHKLIQQ